MNVLELDNVRNIEHLMPQSVQNGLECPSNAANGIDKTPNMVYVRDI